MKTKKSKCRLLECGRIRNQTVTEPETIEADAQLEHARNCPEFKQEKTAIFRLADRFEFFEFKVFNQQVNSAVQLFLAELFLFHVRRFVEHGTRFVVSAARQQPTNALRCQVEIEERANLERSDH